MIKLLIPIVFLLLSVGGPNSNTNENIAGCQLQENLEGWNSRRDYQLLESFISRDTLAHEFNPRYGMYINAIALMKIDSSDNTNRSIVIDRILLYGDPFERQAFKEYFMVQYETYICALIDRYPLKEIYLTSECSSLIHQRKFRSCT